MWRFIDGVSEPKKAKLTDRKQYHDTYDKTKRQRKFLEAWKINRPWLENTEEGMTCIYCKVMPTNTNGSRLFVTGCSSYKLDSITKHENSQQHLHACKVYTAQNKPHESDSEARKIIVSLNKENFDKLDKMFRTCHALVKHNRPISDFTWLCNLDDMKGCNIGRTYRNINSAKVFIQSIAESTFTRALSQKIRAQRFARKRKSIDTVAEQPQQNSNTPPKQFRSKSKQTSSTGSKFLTEEDYRSHITEMKKECEKTKPNDNHISLLLKESFANRREWIKGLESGRVKPILEEFPCFEYGRFLWDEFQLILAEELQLPLEEVNKNAQSLVCSLAKVVKKDKEGSGQTVINYIRYIEKETAYEKGKGVKSSTFIATYNDVEEKEVEEFTDSHEEEGPRLVFFFKDKELEMAVIPTDTVRIYCQAGSVLDAFMCLLASYYVFDLDYPRKYTQCLGFLQQQVIGDAYTGDKSTKFKHFLRKVQKDTNQN